MAWLARNLVREVASLRLLPVIAGIVALATATQFAGSKDFGAFLFFTPVYLSGVALVCFLLCVWAIVERKSPRFRPILISPVVIVATVTGTFWLMPQMKDQIRFALWSHTHGGLLRSFANRDAVIVDWESWGMAGMENDSYLVSNPADDLNEGYGRSAWLRHVGSDCEIVDSKRLEPRLYIVTTYNCSLR